MPIDEIYEELKGKSFKGAKTVEEIPKLAAFQKAMRERAQQSLLDEDVAVWLSGQSEDTKSHVNGMIRHMMAVAGSQPEKV